MSRSRQQRIEFIPIDRIAIPNSRSRNKRIHRAITENIDAVGLKRPITVRQRQGADLTDLPMYDVVCGEGRIESFKMLGQSQIPAIVINATEEDCLLMSLVENIARRNHRPIDIMQEIGHLHKRGYSDNEIAEKIGVTSNWVNTILTLLEKGEERLVVAVETGLVPLSFAIDVARADEGEIQNLLLDAYTTGKLKGKKLNVVRRLLEQRFRRNKSVRDNGLGNRSAHRKVTASDLVRIYQKEAGRQQLLVKKAEFVQSKLLFIVEALKDLLSDEGFTARLRSERLDTMPRALTARIAGSPAL